MFDIRLIYLKRLVRLRFLASLFGFGFAFDEVLCDAEG